MTLRPVAGKALCNLARGVGLALAHNSSREQVLLAMGIDTRMSGQQVRGLTMGAALVTPPATTVAVESAAVQLENTGLGHRATSNGRFNAHTGS